MPPLRDEIEKESSHMDRITQLQDATDQLLTIMFTSIDYLTRKANFKQVSDSIPITQEIPDSEDTAVFEESKLQLVQDLLRKAKQIEFLIKNLPTPAQPGDAALGRADGNAGSPPRLDVYDEFRELEQEMQDANKEFLEALKQAEDLQDELNATIRSMLDEHHRLSSGLLIQ